MNNTEIDRKTILKQFIDTHYEIVDIAEGTNISLLYQHYTNSAKSEKIVEFGGFQRIIVMMPEIKILRKGHSKTLFVNLKPASLQCQEFYNQMNIVYSETCKNLDKQVNQKEDAIEELPLPIVQHPSIRNLESLQAHLESVPSQSQTAEHLGTLQEQVNVRTVNDSIKSSTSTKNAGKKKRKQNNLIRSLKITL